MGQALAGARRFLNTPLENLWFKPLFAIECLRTNGDGGCNETAIASLDEILSQLAGNRVTPNKKKHARKRKAL